MNNYYGLTIMDKDDTLPHYKRVYEILRKHIVDGVFMQGDLLPSENELSAVHEVTRPTIRKALDRLLNEGYIKKQQGKGSIVQGKPKGIGILSLSGTTSAIGSDNLITKMIVKPEIRSWDEAFTFPLSDKEKEVGCIYFERLRLVNNKPALFDITMIPNMYVPRFTVRNFEINSLFEILRKKYQIEVTGGEQKILAISANKNLQSFFNVKPNHPLLQLDRKIETNKVDFFIYSQLFCDTDEHALYGTF